jgi:gluconokinase
LRAVIAAPAGFVLLDTDREELLRRMTARPHHYMPATLLQSQLDTLERPQADEWAVTLDARRPAAVLCDEAIDWLLASKQ